MNRHVFEDPALLEQALTHPSYSNEHPGAPNYERLEFLGDAVLQLVSSEVLLAAFPAWDEGALSKARSQLVDRRQCAQWSEALGLPGAMRAERGLVVTADSKVRANLFEAWVGAVWTDGGLTAARAVIGPLVENAARALSAESLRDPKSALQEHCQARGAALPEYRYLGATGPDHARAHQVEVVVDDRVFGPVTARQKKLAEVEAARLALAGLTAAD